MAHRTAIALYALTTLFVRPAWFLVNAIGVMWDSQITDERDTNRDWNAIWVSRSRRDDEGWTVEIAIPLPVPPLSRERAADLGHQHPPECSVDETSFRT
jgi:hypothetical protein